MLLHNQYLLNVLNIVITAYHLFWSEDQRLTDCVQSFLFCLFVSVFVLIAIYLAHSACGPIAPPALKAVLVQPRNVDA